MKHVRTFDEFLNESLNESNPQPDNVSEILKKLKIKHRIIPAIDVKPKDVQIAVHGESNYRGLKNNTRVVLKQYPSGISPEKFVKCIIYDYDLLGFKDKYTESLGLDWDWDIIVVDGIKPDDKETITKLVKQINNVGGDMFKWWYDF